MNHLCFIFLLASVAYGYNPEDFIHAFGATNYGFWGATEACKNGSYAYGFQLKIESEHGAFTDDTSVNAIKLFCRDPSGVDTGEVTSSVMSFGSWSTRRTCQDGSYVRGYMLKSDGTSSDLTAANALRMWCSGPSGEELIEPGNKWGGWLDRADCGGDKVICGLMTLVQESQGSFNDDTALNDVRFLCCDPPAVV
ncbi:vitelline membrane outer layer protein 1 homolog [Penaeus japonicus]|uniref:vitelline membrane outer layer protein 1 homolog n=1 Tax=Penaeus japonicus TaxID=27405 RepID=UPI001C7128CB|nr:vitelline membrane outer layer protein 1 homolog [Penaeus japonicus]